MKHHLTLQQLADILGCERQYVWSIENAAVNITADYIDKLAIAFKISPTEFLTTSIH